MNSSITTARCTSRLCSLNASSSIRSDSSQKPISTFDFGTYSGRKERKRQFRQLWIARINAAARINGLSYSKFMYGLKLAGVEMNRKVLSDMAINDAEGFAKLAELAKSKLA